jgi:hypothetical protein
VIAASLCAVASGGCVLAAALAPAAPSGGSAGQAGLAAWLDAQPKWSASVAAEGGFGYKDNLLLSSTAEEQSGFARGSVEALLLRLPTKSWDCSVFAQVEGTRFFTGRTVKDESSAWLQADSAWRVGSEWKLSLPATGYYYDQVFDVSDTEVERLVTELKVFGLKAGPAARWTFHPSGWVEVHAGGERKWYDDRVNDGHVGESALRLGWTPGRSVEWRLTGVRRWRKFDSRRQYSAAGRELSGTHLKIEEKEGELRLGVKWDEKGRWRTTTRLGELHYRDNGSGYFDYRERRFENELEWNREPWLVRGGGSVRRVDFDRQTVGLGIGPPARLKEEYVAELRLERELGRQWTLLASYTWERSRANDLISSYEVNEGLLGVRWSWEK